MWWLATGDARSASSTWCSSVEGLLVFCEVKTRIGSAFGGGYEAVTWSKRRTLRQLAEVFLASSARPDQAAVRFDVASVWLGPRGADVEIFEDAF